MNGNLEFDTNKILLVAIDSVRPNDWNPKLRDTDEYKKIVESIKVNGFKNPIIVRENDDGDSKYEILDGEQRWRACKELGLKKIYIFNEGIIPDEKAKSVTLWTQVQIPFDELQLAPLVAELNDLQMTMPYTEDEVQDFVNMLHFDFEGDGKINLSVKCTPEQFDKIQEYLNIYIYNNEVEEDKALVEMVKLGVKRYE